MNDLKLVKEYSTKAELVYKSLVEAILHNKVLPGTRLIIKEIADQLSVSDIPVREALKMLESTGLIEMKPHIGSIVAIPSPEWIEEVFVIRASLEGLAIRTSIPFLNEEDIQRIVYLDWDMKVCVKTGKHAEYARFDRKFHEAIMEKSPYPNLLKMVAELLLKSQYGQTIFGLKPNTMKISDSEHDELINALRERNGFKAEAITIEHRLRVGKELSDVIRSY